MQSGTQNAPVTKMVWVGRVLSALMVLFMLVDGGIKVLKLAPAVEGTVRLGYPASLVQPIGIIALLCVILYAIPRTAILGAILLTGYLRGRDRDPSPPPGPVVPLSGGYRHVDLGGNLLPR